MQEVAQGERLRRGGAVSRRRDRIKLVRTPQRRG
jgi:hypothetical protein